MTKKANYPLPLKPAVISTIVARARGPARPTTHQSKSLLLLIEFRRSDVCFITGVTRRGSPSSVVVFGFIDSESVSFACGRRRPAPTTRHYPYQQSQPSVAGFARVQFNGTSHTLFTHTGTHRRARARPFGTANSSAFRHPNPSQIADILQVMEMCAV